MEAPLLLSTRPLPVALPVVLPPLALPLLTTLPALLMLAYFAFAASTKDCWVELLSDTTVEEELELSVFKLRRLAYLALAASTKERSLEE